jgi:LytR cell envelope-related transcriptional attenuator
MTVPERSEGSDRRTVRWIALLALVACRGAGEHSPRHAIPGESGPRVIVEVLNASGKPGLARAATRALRQAGVDVVYFGTAPAEVGTLDSTRILVRRGSASNGERVRRALRTGRVILQPDSTRLLDASVLLGADFTPPRTELHP